MPSLYVMDESQQRIWIEGLINTVFLKDIVSRYAIRDVDLLKSIFLYLVNTTSDQCNLTNIKNYLIQQ
jgi:predicted AAA+ superfamily ATPase